MTKKAVAKLMFYNVQQALIAVEPRTVGTKPQRHIGALGPNVDQRCPYSGFGKFIRSTPVPLFNVLTKNFV